LFRILLARYDVLTTVKIQVKVIWVVTWSCDVRCVSQHYTVSDSWRSRLESC